MADAGTHAMEEIYISWKDSVYAAHQRYGELMEAKKNGQLILRHHALTNAALSFHEGFLREYGKLHAALSHGTKPESNSFLPARPEGYGTKAPRFRHSTKASRHGHENDQEESLEEQ